LASGRISEILDWLAGHGSEAGGSDPMISPS
jgi:hypothetical protein